MSPVYPRSMSHIGLSVTDLEEAVEFYRKVLGWYVIMEPTTITEDEGLVDRVVAAGGKQRMPVRYYFPGEKPYRMVYCEDPFGNIVEIYSHSYELTYSAGAYDS